eukprot:gene3292-13954_t
MNTVLKRKFSRHLLPPGTQQPPLFYQQKHHFGLRNLTGGRSVLNAQRVSQSMEQRLKKWGIRLTILFFGSNAVYGMS